MEKSDLRMIHKEFPINPIGNLTQLKKGKNWRGLFWLEVL
jgi:hypothetical protein